jgi:hypothetical protein
LARNRAAGVLRVSHTAPRWAGPAERAATLFVAGRRLLNVERFGACGLPRCVGGNFVDAGFGLSQQFFAAALEAFAALIDRNRSSSGTLPSSSRFTIDPVLRSRVRSSAS